MVLLNERAKSPRVTYRSGIQLISDPTGTLRAPDFTCLCLRFLLKLRTRLIVELIYSEASEMTVQKMANAQREAASKFPSPQTAKKFGNRAYKLSLAIKENAYEGNLNFEWLDILDEITQDKGLIDSIIRASKSSNGSLNNIPRMANLTLQNDKVCPRCKGRLSSQKDQFGSFLQCFPCGYIHEPQLTQEKFKEILVEISRPNKTYHGRMKI